MCDEKRAVFERPLKLRKMPSQNFVLRSCEPMTFGARYEFLTETSDGSPAAFSITTDNYKVVEIKLESELDTFYIIAALCYVERNETAREVYRELDEAPTPDAKTEPVQE